MVPMHHQHGQGRRPWNLLHVVSGPWTSFVAALDKGQSNIAVCRRHRRDFSLDVHYVFITLLFNTL
jgi:hypothetical protein